MGHALPKVTGQAQPRPPCRPPRLPAPLKAAQAQTRPSFQALNDWVLWVHVQESQVRNGIFEVFLGFILLAFGVPKLDWSSAFFAGYSIDSVTELFLERFQAVVKTRAQQLAAPAQA